MSLITQCYTIITSITQFYIYYSSAVSGAPGWDVEYLGIGILVVTYHSRLTTNVAVA